MVEEKYIYLEPVPVLNYNSKVPLGVFKDENEGNVSFCLEHRSTSTCCPDYRFSNIRFLSARCIKAPVQSIINTVLHALTA